MVNKKWTRKEMLKLLSAPFLLNSKFVSGFTGKASVPMFNQKPLAYRFDALEPYIDALTMEIHYTKHASSYCANLNDAIRKYSISGDVNIEIILDRISSYSMAVRNNAGGHYNHELFWACMIPKGSDLKEGLFKSHLLQAFDSIQNFQKIFTDVAINRFGSGWAWLYLDANKNLKIDSTPNQDNPLMDMSPVKGYPLLCLDVWEHAYYLKRQNRRAEYISQWWNIVNWDLVAERYNSRMI